jgi:hypothetical protein
MKKRGGRKVNNKGKDLKEQKGKCSIKLLIGTLVGCILVVIILIMTAELRQYQKGKKLFASEDYEQAAIIFKELQNYKDSEQLYYECIYAIGEKQYERGHYTTALDTLETVLDHELAKELFLQISLQYGTLLMESENYEQAAIYLEEVDLEGARELYEKAIALKGSYVYNGRFYQTPDGIKEQVEMIFSEKNISWSLSELTIAEETQTLCYYLLDEEKTVQNAFIYLFGYDETKQNMASLTFSFEWEQIEQEKWLSTLAALIMSCNPDMNYQEALNVYQILQEQIEETEEMHHQIITYEKNNVEYTLDYNTKTSIYKITPIEK